MAVVGISQPTLRIFRNGIDREVSTNQIFFETDLGIRMEDEPAIAWAALAFRSGKGIFLPCFRVQKYREIRTDRAETLAEHFIGGCAHHDPVGIGDGLAQQAITYCAAHFINLHKKPP